MRQKCINPGKVLKVVDYKRHSHTPLQYLDDRITLHNDISDVPYKLVGFTTTENFMGKPTFAMVVEQTFVQGWKFQ